MQPASKQGWLGYVIELNNPLIVQLRSHTCTATDSCTPLANFLPLLPPLSSPSVHPPAEVGVVSRAGREYDDWKLTNQDCHLVLPLPSTCDLATAASSDEEAPVAAEQHPRSVALGVFDGHGVQGTAARWAAACMQKTGQLVHACPYQQLWP